MKIPDLASLKNPLLQQMYQQMTSRCLIMGILNVTPDSFSDGGAHFEPGRAIDAALAMEADGADIIDIGGESTRPGAAPVSVVEEINRVVPVINALSSQLKIPISIDTSKSEVAKAAVQAGARILNDVTGLQADPLLADIAGQNQLPLVIMHMRGTPQTMQQNVEYHDIVFEISDFFSKQLSLAAQHGVPPEFVIIDPGFGFAKSPNGNLELLRRLGEFTETGRPIMVGASRKSTLGLILGGAGVEQRLEATAASVAVSIYNGANIVRVHDVAPMVKVVKTADAILRGIS